MRDLKLHPLPEGTHDCPHCQEPLQVRGWLIPGMRNLADLRCSSCSSEFYGDLAAGQALYTPMLIEKESGVVYDRHGVDWFADWLRTSYANRKELPVSFEVEERLPITRQVVLLNCLDTLYGHSLLKLLNAQWHLEDVDLILIIPSFLAWMIPEGVAQVWKVGLPLKRGIEWNDWIAREIHHRVEAFEAASLSVALSHPHPGDYEIERFTKIKPFAVEEWEERLDRPVVTFIWRDDRLWQVLDQDSIGGARKRFIPRGVRVPDLAALQGKLVVELAEGLRVEWPGLDFAVAGLSELYTDRPLPSWIKDLRQPKLDDSSERLYCERYAKSHIVVGVHGSNMLLPSAHAGAVVELIGPERWGNFLQDILINEADDCRDTLFRYRFLPISARPETVRDLAGSLLHGAPNFRHLMNVR